MKMDFAYAAGFAVGLIGVLVVFFIIWKVKGSISKGYYDERQELIRGRGYKYAFFTVMGLLAAYLVADGTGVLEMIPFTGAAIAFAILIAGVLVYALYCIKYDAYFGVGMNKKSYKILMLFVIGINAFSVIMDFMTGSYDGGKIALGPSMQILCVIVFSVILIALQVKDRKAAIEEAEEEEENEEGGDFE